VLFRDCRYSFVVYILNAFSLYLDVSYIHYLSICSIKFQLVVNLAVYSLSETPLRVRHVFSMQPHGRKVHVFNRISDMAILVPIVC
jgi:hypothetical protein